MESREPLVDDSTVGYVERPSEMKEKMNDPGMIKIGRHNDVPDDEFIPEELAMGIEVEHEHTDCPIMAKAIAKDHLSECERYYTKLREMEKNCKD